MIYLIDALYRQYEKLNLIDQIPQLLADLQSFYVMGICNICRNGGGIREQKEALRAYASDAVFSDYGICDEQYGNYFTRLCRRLTLNKKWGMLVIACRLRNCIRRFHY